MSNLRLSDNVILSFKGKSSAENRTARLSVSEEMEMFLMKSNLGCWQVIVKQGSGWYHSKAQS